MPELVGSVLWTCTVATVVLALCMALFYGESSSGLYVWFLAVATGLAWAYFAAHYLFVLVPLSVGWLVFAWFQHRRATFAQQSSSGNMATILAILLPVGLVAFWFSIVLPDLVGGFLLRSSDSTAAKSSLEELAHDLSHNWEAVFVLAIAPLILATALWRSRRVA